MLVVIYETKFTSVFSVVCSAVTASGYSHGAILSDGVLYDTTFTRGHFAPAPPVEATRKVAVIDVGGDCAEWVLANLGVKYDTLGLLLWFFRVSTVGRMYCFNVVENALASNSVRLNLGWRKSGGTILTALLNKGYPVEVLTGKKFNERYLT